MLASHRSLGSLAPQSVVRVRPDAATKSLNVCCSCPPSPRSKAIPRPAPTTIENGPKESATIKPSSPALDADQTCCSRCSETAPSTNPGLLNLQQQLDENYRSTPRTPDRAEIMLKMATGHFGNNFFMSRQWKIACN